jgi:hypothetical protein
LLDNDSAMALFPLPNSGNKLGAPKIVTSLAFFPQLPLNHRLGGDSGVIHAGKPKYLLTQHPSATSKNVLNGII